jgi:nicotinate-nucleotide--dimethylbenzimidazole phosphoribosyltransferase
MTDRRPFDDFSELLDRLTPPDVQAESRTRRVLESAPLPGRFGDIACWISRWSGRPPAVRRPMVAIFAGAHGVASRGISSGSSGATATFVAACGEGTAALNQICAAQDLGLKVFDLALDVPTGDITVDDAMDERTCAATMAFGMEAIAGGADLICLGDSGAGNSTVAAALLAALFRDAASGDFAPAAESKDSTLLARKREAVRAALARVAGQPAEPFEILRRVGGREFAAISGAILAARMERIPVVLDGFSALAAAAVLHARRPAAIEHCVLAAADSPAARLAAERLGLEPLLGEGFCAGEGAAAAVAAGIVRSAAQSWAGLATVSRAG